MKRMVYRTDWLHVAENVLISLGTLGFIVFIYLAFVGKVG